MTAVAVSLLLGLHLMCMNVAAAGPLVCLWLEWREARSDLLAGRAGRYLAASALVLLVAGVLLGLAMGWLLWSDAYLAALKRLRSRAEFGVWELLFSLVLMVAHFLWWRRRPTCGRWERAVRSLFPLAAGTNLMYHFPPLFAILSQLAVAVPGEPLSSPDFRARMLSGEVLARSTHFALAAVAMCGVMLIGYALWLGRRGKSDEEVHRAAKWGSRLALVPTLVQLGVGVWVFLALPEPVQLALMGGDLIGTALLALSVLAALALMHQLAAIVLGDVRWTMLIRSMATMVIVVMLMSATLERIRVTRVAAPLPPASMQSLPSS